MQDYPHKSLLLKMKVNNIFFFSAYLCPQSSVLVLSADNLCKQFGPRSGSTKCFFRECMHVQSYIRFHCSRGSVTFLFSAHMFVLNHLLLTSTDNLLKQLGPGPGPRKRSFEDKRM